MLRTGGFAWDISVAVIEGDVNKHFVLCAAWRAGLVGWVITEDGSSLSMNEDPDFKVPSAAPARAVDCFVVGSDLYAVVGTHEDWDTKGFDLGSLYLFHIHESGGSYVCEEIDAIATDGGIFHVDATTALQKSSGEEAALFAAASRYGVQRFKIDLDDPSDKFSLQASYPSPHQDVFARDVLVYEDSSVLYAACYEDLVQVFNVSSPGSITLYNPQPDWRELRGKAADALDLLEVQGSDPLLFIALGPNLKDEYQYWGSSDIPRPPKGSNSVATGMLYGATHDGVVFWEITANGEPKHNGHSELIWSDQDRNAFCFAIPHGSGYLLYLAHHNKRNFEGAFSIFQVDNHLDPKDCTKLVRYNGSADEAPGNYVEVAVVPDGTKQIAYVSFGPSEESDDSGIHVFEVSFNPARIGYKTTKWFQNPDAQGARLNLYSDKIYGAFGPGGIGVYDYSQNKTSPVEVGKRTLKVHGEPASAIQVRPFSHQGKILAYVTLLSGHLAVVDVTDENSFDDPYLLYETRFQALGVVFDTIVHDPYDPEQCIILADGRGGVHRVVVPDLIE